MYLTRAWQNERRSGVFRKFLISLSPKYGGKGFVIPKGRSPKAWPVPNTREGEKIYGRDEKECRRLHFDKWRGRPAAWGLLTKHSQSLRPLKGRAGEWETRLNLRESIKRIPPTNQRDGGSDHGEMNNSLGQESAGTVSWKKPQRR